MEEMLTHAAAWMKLQAAVLSEVSQAQGHRVRVHLYEVFAAHSYCRKIAECGAQGFRSRSGS